MQDPEIIEKVKVNDRILNGTIEVWRTTSKALDSLDRVLKGTIKIWHIAADLTRKADLILQQQSEILSRLKKLEATRPSRRYTSRPLAEYKSFDWTSIGAEILERDEDGVSSIQIGLDIYTRRAPQNKFKPAIWFARYIGEGKYERAIVFEDIEVDGISRKAKEALS